jgi:hypothetical protein
LIENLLKELMKTKKVLVPVAGALTDAATVGFTTLVGSSIGGPVGAVAGIWPFWFMSFYIYYVSNCFLHYCHCLQEAQ